MKLYCCLCGHAMRQAAVLIGSMPVGVTCAKRAGLFDLIARKSNQVFAVPHARPVAKRRNVNLELFENPKETT